MCVGRANSGGGIGGLGHPQRRGFGSSMLTRYGLDNYDIGSYRGYTDLNNYRLPAKTVAKIPQRLDKHNADKHSAMVSQPNPLTGFRLPADTVARINQTRLPATAKTAQTAQTAQTQGSQNPLVKV